MGTMKEKSDDDVIMMMIWEREVRANLTLGVIINKQEVSVTKFSTNHCSFHVNEHPQTILAVWWVEL